MLALLLLALGLGGAALYAQSRGIPQPAEGGQVFGAPVPGRTYFVATWDPYRGLYISSDCELVVEGPGWYCGTLEVEGGEIVPLGPDASLCNAVSASNYDDTMAVDGNGVAGYIDALFEQGWEPEQVAHQILTEINPECGLTPPDYWPAGLRAWHADFLSRVAWSYEEHWGIEFVLPTSQHRARRPGPRIATIRHG